MKITKIVKSLLLIILTNSFYAYYKKLKTAKNFKHLNLIVGLNVNIHKVEFGRNVFLGKNIKLNKVSISDHSYVNSNSNISNTKIGKYCSIASNVNINLGEHPSNFISTHPAFYSNNKPYKTFADKEYHKEFSEVEIGNDVWIGFNVTILGNVKIGDGAIIGAGSVVTHDVRPYSIVGGVPAKLIKYRFEKHYIERLLEIKWWNKNEDWVEKNFILFKNIKNIKNF